MLMSSYVLKEYEKNILFRIPFTVYFVWRDPEYNKLRLVVKELCDNQDMLSGASAEYYYLVI